MPNRSQAHLLRTGRNSSGGVRPPSPAITGVLPDTATLAAAGAVSRTIATLSAAGGVPPFTWSTVSAGGLSFNIIGNSMVTTVDPCGTVGLHTAQVMATDSFGKTLTEPIAVTLT